VAASQTRAVLSLTVTMRRPSGENAALRVRFRRRGGPRRPERARRRWPHQIAQSGREAVTMRRPSGENATLRTIRSRPEVGDL
jgi:hypothetical protein